MAGKAVPIVEDEPRIGEIIEYTPHGEPSYRATALADRASALAFVAEVMVDLIGPDINMSGRDGFAIHDLLRGKPTTADVPVLFMTRGLHEEEFARRGVTTWIRRPFDSNELLVGAAMALGGGPSANGA